MNTATTMQGARRPDRRSKIEDVVNRMADALMEGVEALNNAADEVWKSIRDRVARKHA